MDKKKQIEAFYPLSPMQQGMLFHTLYDTDSRMYVEQTVFTLSGDLDVSAFKRAWEQVVDRHPTLRTIFMWEGLKAPVQIVNRRVELPWKLEDWRDLSPDEQEARIQTLLADDRA